MVYGKLFGLVALIIGGILGLGSLILMLDMIGFDVGSIILMLEQMGLLPI